MVLDDDILVLRLCLALQSSEGLKYGAETGLTVE